MKYIVAVLVAFLLTACDASTKERTSDFVLPAELKEAGCKIYRMQQDGAGATLYTVYCPNANTSTGYTSGKTRINTSVINGVQQ
ncbi:Uncharacterised protein [Escherichia coli]|uniref:hypothetical protein n=1 Tax=Escherichia coli TaxID=562 RepID=UPI001A374745|nr:hypothetical protein [Escherichia coli]EHV4444336.1 hypothetical protein [Escherichia coli]VVZ31092.1 Uncharacterised protein [Escherichia coli]VWN20948.1 Uncharacterised protein [Escherichia coli]HBN4943332.1 hypothetical protein [Escherichia coli]